MKLSVWYCDFCRHLVLDGWKWEHWNMLWCNDAMTNRFGGFAFVCLFIWPITSFMLPSPKCSAIQTSPCVQLWDLVCLGIILLSLKSALQQFSFHKVQWIHLDCEQCKSWASQMQFLHFPASQTFHCLLVSISFPGMPTGGMVCVQRLQPIIVVALMFLEYLVLNPLFPEVSVNFVKWSIYWYQYTLSGFVCI